MKDWSCILLILLLLSAKTGFSDERPSIAGPDKARPNIVFVMADDMGWGQTQ